MNHLTRFLPLLAVLATNACAVQSQDSSPTTNTNPTDGVHAAPPARPERGDATGVTRWFVVRSFDLGTTDAGWRSLGYDLDGKITSAADSQTSLGTCLRAHGSAAAVLTDGDEGIDNNFGGHLFGTMRSIKSDTLETINASIAHGGETLLLRLDGVDGDDDANVTGAVYTARHADGVPPTFAAGDHFSVVSSALWDGVDLAKPRYAFPWGYMRGGVWVSGPLERMDLTIGLNTDSAHLELPLDRVQLSFRVADGSAGVLAGVANTSRVWTGMKPFFDVSCDSNPDTKKILSVVADDVLALSDLVDGDDSLQDTSKPCDAMSVGMGFVAAPVAAPDAVVAPVPATAPVDCAPPKP